MATVEFESSPPQLPRPRRLADNAPAATAGIGGRLALISTYDELCGIAAYTRALERQLNRDFEVAVFDLNQFLLRSSHARVRRFADQQIREICRRLPRHDMVNLQLEFGILGRRATDILRRLRWIVAAAPRISVTFHTVFQPERLDRRRMARKLLHLDLVNAANILSEYRRYRLLSAGVIREIRRAQREKPVSIIVHNRRDAQQMKFVYGLRNVFDHPLSFLGESEARLVRASASRSSFAMLDGLPAGAKLVGVFGFLGRYKGFETVIRAMHHLPPDYHLLIFGGVHPNEIKPQQEIDPVLAGLFNAGYVDTTLTERMAGPPKSFGTSVSLAVDASIRDLLITHPKDLSARIHFLGPTSDADFLTGMAICDVAVFPYLEVGQSSSGPISQALELGCRVIASRTHTFLQFGRYHREWIEYFDIGNHLELAARILARPQYGSARRPLAFTVDTNRAVYRAANLGSAAPLAEAAE